MKKKIRKKRIGIGLLVVGLLLLFVLSSMNRNLLWIEKPFKELLFGVQKGMNIPLEGFVKKDAMLDLTRSKEREEEIKTLQELLDLKTILTDFEIVYATTINRNVSMFQELLTIDKGASEGIKKDMAVVTENGLIGKIDKVTDHFSEVKLLTSLSEDRYQVSVMVEGDEKYFGVLNQYQLDTNTFYITGIPTSAKVKEGSVVTTSGLGGIFPSGIYVGTVKEAKEDSYGISKQISVVAKQNFHDIKYLAVLKREVN